MTKKQEIATIKMLVRKYAAKTPLEYGNVYSPKNRFNHRICIDSSGVLGEDDYGEFDAFLPTRRKPNVIVTGWFMNGVIHFDHNVAWGC